MVVVLLAATACGGGTPARSTQPPTIEHYTLHSRFVKQPLHEIRIVPAEHGNWTLVLLHCAHCTPAGMLHLPIVSALQKLGPRAPVVILPDGGYDSWWHDRAGGAWGTMVLKEIVPKHGRVAIGGISMGGYGALLLGAQGRFCAIGGHSPALFPDYAESAPGAFDNARDFARNGLLNHPPHYSAPVWIDVGTGDPLRNDDVTYAHEIHAEIHLWDGGHDIDYWSSHLQDYFAFYARHCA